MKTILAAGAALLAQSAGAHDITKEFADSFAVKLQTSEEVLNLLSGHEVDHIGKDGQDIHVKVSGETKRALEDAGIQLEDTTESWISYLESNLADPNHRCLDSAEDCAGRDLQSFYSSYQTRTALYNRAASVTSGLDFVSTQSIGQSYEGRNLLVYNIGDQSKPWVFYFCNIHAREWLTPMYCTYMIENLVADGGHPLLDDFSFSVLISANPDGYEYTWSNERLWRKTRAPNAGSTCVGTDPNRNWAEGWGGEGSSGDRCSQTYRGTAPFDQAETSALRDFVNANSDRIINFNDVHSYSSMWMYPYAGNYGNPADAADMNLCSRAAVDAIQDTTGGALWAYGTVANVIYIASGGSVDYLYEEVGCKYPFTLELRGTSFDPPASNILPSNREVFAGMVASLECIADVEFNGGGGGDGGDGGGGGDPNCVDLSPSGITVGGVPTPCDQLGIYCAGYDFVRDRCPETCGECATGVVASRDSGEVRDIQPGLGSNTIVAIVAVLGAMAAALVAVIAMLAVRLRKQSQEVEVAKHLEAETSL